VFHRTMSEVVEYSDRLQTRAQRAARWADRIEDPLHAVTDFFPGGDKPLPVRVGKALIGLCQVHALIIPAAIADKTFVHALRRDVEGLEVHAERVHVDGGARSVDLTARYYRLPESNEFVGATAVARQIVAAC